MGRATSGFAVRAGAPTPDISTPDAMKKTLLAARTVAYGIQRAVAPPAYSSPACSPGSASPMRSHAALGDKWTSQTPTK
jgi:hypothetical protein